VKYDRLRTLPSRTYEPRCTQAPWRTLGLVLTMPLVMGASVSASIVICERMRSPVLPSLVAAAMILTAWIWTFSRRGPIARGGHLVAARRLRRHPDDPWTADHKWDPRGAKPVRRPGLRPSGCIWMLLPWAICMTLAWAPTVMLVMLGVAFLAWLWSRVLASGARRAFAAFVRFPYHPGEPVEVHFGMEPGAATFLRARYVLRRVEEFEASWFAGGPQRGSTYAAECLLPEGVLPGPESDVRLLFDVPAGAGGTSLSAPLPSYWELLVVGETTKGWFDETFLVPVYERPAAAPAA